MKNITTPPKFKSFCSRSERRDQIVEIIDNGELNRWKQEISTYFFYDKQHFRLYLKVKVSIFTKMNKNETVMKNWKHKEGMTKFISTLS